MSSDQVRHFRIDQMEQEELNPLISRSLISGERVMLAHVYLKKGAVVPKHSHDNEQITYVIDGALKFWIGDEGEELVVADLLASVRSLRMTVKTSPTRRAVTSSNNTMEVAAEYTAPSR